MAQSDVSHAGYYDAFTARNAGYIDAQAQERIRRTRLLIAGCGMGSGAAVCAARLGFEHFILADGDEVGLSNLNRQFYGTGNLGQNKAAALREQILAVNPQAQVQVVDRYLDEAAMQGAVGEADCIIDTIDFLDLPAILALHRAASAQRKPIITAMNAGRGALVWYFPPGTEWPLDRFVPLPDERATGAYAQAYGLLMQQMLPYLDAEVVAAVRSTLGLMQQGRPCPASQLAIGSFTAAAAVMSLVTDMLAGRRVTESPSLVIHSMASQRVQVVTLTQPVQAA